MIDIDSIPNWKRWTEKEKSGVNRGYSHAFYNANRQDHRVLISERKREYRDEYKADLKVRTKDRKDTLQSVSGPTRQADSLRSQLVEPATDWMIDHPCKRTGDGLTGVELLSDILEALRERGIEPQHDQDVMGFIRPGRIDGTSMNIHALATAPSETDSDYSPVDSIDEADTLKIRLSVDGEASGLSFHEYTEADSDGEVRQMHEPSNQSKLHAPVRDALVDVGLDPESVSNGGYQQHWDYSTSYLVVAPIPDGLTLRDPDDAATPSNRKRRSGALGW